MSKNLTPDFSQVDCGDLVLYRIALQKLIFRYEGCPEKPVLEKCFKDVADEYTSRIAKGRFDYDALKRANGGDYTFFDEQEKPSEQKETSPVVRHGLKKIKKLHI